MTTARTIAFVLFLACVLAAGGAANTHTVVIDDADGDLARWQVSMTPEYYKGGFGNAGLDWADDPDRGMVLRCRFGFGDPDRSEPVFITRKLDRPIPRIDVLGVRFQAKLSAPVIDPANGFILRLRTSPTQHDNWNVQELQGQPFPVNRWVRVHIDTALGSNVRNIWGRAFDTVKQMTLRLDDLDARNGSCELLIDDIEIVVRERVSEEPYTPRPRPRPSHRHPVMLHLRHRAAGHVRLDAALRQLAPEARIDTCYYRGRHLELVGFPDSADAVLAYDIIAMVDVDPFVMSREQCCRIADAVVSGSHLILTGGPVTLSDSWDFSPVLAALLPVTFAAGEAPVTSAHRPAPGPPHRLNAGFDPAGLGQVRRAQPLEARAEAAVAWTVGDLPLVATWAVGSGRVTVINAHADVSRTRDGDLFTSPLGDDLLRQCLHMNMEPDREPAIVHLGLPSPPAGGGTVAVDVRIRRDRAAEYRVLVNGVAAASGTVEDGLQRVPLELPAPVLTREFHDVCVQAIAHGRVIDWRDMPVEVRHPLQVSLQWPLYRTAFAPGFPVCLNADVSLPGLPRITPGASTSIRFGDDIPVHIRGFADVWLEKDGVPFHDQAGPARVETVRQPGLLPAWTVTGVAQAARPNEQLAYADSPHILDCRRTITCRTSGAVTVTTAYTFLQDVQVHRLPLLVELPVPAFSGLTYAVLDRDGAIAQRGRFPVEPSRGTLFSRTDAGLRIDAPGGSLSIHAAEPGLALRARDLRQYNMPVYRIEVEPPFVTKAASRGDTYSITVNLSHAGTSLPAATVNSRALTATARLEDPITGFTWPIPPQTAHGTAFSFAGVLPNLRSGHYLARVDVHADGNRVTGAETTCSVVDPLDKHGFFPIMSIIGIESDGHYLDPAGIRDRVDDLKNHGFNTAAITGCAHFIQPGVRYSRALKAYAQEYAQSVGMATTFEYSNFTLYRRRATLTPCVFAPHYAAAARSYLEPRIELGRRTPRLLTAKVVDEPTCAPGQIDGCERCRTAFQERYGIPFAETDTASPPYQRWAMADFRGFYVGEIFRHGRDVVQTADVHFDLLLTYMATGLGYNRPLTHQQDALDWSRFVGWADFDVYPYFYPASQRLRMVQAGFAMACMRDIARQRSIPWGFYVELDDRNWPFQKNPEEASAECAFTAIASGAQYLNSFIHRLASTGSGARPARWEKTGRAMRLIRRCGPLLTTMQTPRAPAAFLFPNTHEALENGYDRPDYSLALARAGYGDIDVHFEDHMRESGEVPYDVLILLRTTSLHQDAAAILLRWLRAGGILVTDHVPTLDHCGEELAWPFGPVDDAPPPSAPAEELAHRRLTVGNGRVMLLQTDPEVTAREYVEADNPAPNAVAALRAAWRHLLEPLAPPHVRVDYHEDNTSVDTVDAGIRTSPAAALLTVVNHHPEPRRVVLHLRRGDLRWFVDMETMTPIDAEPPRAENAELTLEIPGRWGRIIAAYRTAPRNVTLEVDTSTCPPGGRFCYRTAVHAAGVDRTVMDVLVNCAVFAADGAPVPRFSRRFASGAAGTRVDVDVPLNAVPGEYRIEAVLPQCGGTSATASVHITPSP